MEVLDAPVPVLVGLPKRMRKAKPGHTHIVWVLLDEPGSKVQVDETLRREVHEPYASDMKQYLSRHYAKIVSKGQIYPDSAEVLTLACDIAKEFTDFWESILKELPLETPMNPDGDYIDEEELAQTVIPKFPRQDHAFLSQFLCSQIFLTHVEDRKLMAAM